jgi:nucleoside-diphosphate-sugar epimerase
MGDVLSALTSVDDRYTLSSPSDVSVVHLGAIPAPGLTPNHVVFQTNVVSTYNVLEACRLRGIRNIVLASSETLIGLPLVSVPLLVIV